MKKFLLKIESNCISLIITPSQQEQLHPWTAVKKNWSTCQTKKLSYEDTDEVIICSFSTDKQ